MSEELTLEKLEIHSRLIKVETHVANSNGSLKRIEEKLDILDGKIDNILPKCAVHSTKIEAQGGQLKAIWVFVSAMFLSVFGYFLSMIGKNGR